MTSGSVSFRYLSDRRSGDSEYTIIWTSIPAWYRVLMKARRSPGVQVRRAPNLMDPFTAHRVA